jgi:predicted amidohydrolase YtcJ
LTGKWVMPSFIDNHCHILPTGLDLQKLYLGACRSHEEVLERVRERLPQIEPGQWLLAVHYDQTRYPGGEHLTRYQLDKISGDVPILLRHSSGHASVANTAALRAAGIREDEPDFKGGAFRRGSDGVIDGVLLEHAHEKVTAAAPAITHDQMVDAILLAAERMADYGIACASDMMTGRFDLQNELRAYAEAAKRGARIRFRLYAQWGAVFGPRRLEPTVFDELVQEIDCENCRLAGIKIFADGAIGAGTAAIYGRYATGISDNGDGTSGTLMYSIDRLNEMVRTAHDAGYSVAVHSIGDHSTDVVMDAIEATDEPSRHRIEHVMLLSDPQIERLAKLGVHVTMQPEFLRHFSHSYERQLGPERKRHLNRAASVLRSGIPLSFSSDRPIVEGDPRAGIEVLTGRPDGYDPSENITGSEAWLGYTSRAASANGDVAGALRSGEPADLQIFTDRPTQLA